jgi:hypothetical protein
LDKNGFDDLTRKVAQGVSRRTLLRGLIGGGAAAVVGVKATSTLAQNAGKVDICHALGNGGYNLISVNMNALEAHLAHGDIAPTECENGLSCGPCSTICANAALVGYENNSLPFGICVDDRLTIYVNGAFLTEVVGCGPQVELGELQVGDEIRLTVGDDFPPCSLEPLQLVCLDTAESQELVPEGFCRGVQCENGTDDWTGFGVCYDQTFNVTF